MSLRSGRFKKYFDAKLTTHNFTHLCITREIPQLQAITNGIRYFGVDALYSHTILAINITFEAITVRLHSLHHIKGMVNCQNSQYNGPLECNNARG